MKIGCQTITFGENQRDHFDAMFFGLRESGYSGVEIGYRRLEGYDPEKLKQLLDSHGLELFASHIGGNLDDTSQADRERSLLDDVLDALEVLDVKLLMYSGLRFIDDDEFNNDLEMIRRSADLAADRGIRLLYHNHNWEMRSDAKIMNALIERGGEKLGFCPDIGWIYKGGKPIREILDAVEGRIGAIHIKDFATAGVGDEKETVDTVEFGRGVVPIPEALDWAVTHAKGAWIVAEQDVTSLDPAEAVAINAAYLNKLVGELQ